MHERCVVYGGLRGGSICFVFVNKSTVKATGGSRAGDIDQRNITKGLKDTGSETYRTGRGAETGTGTEIGTGTGTGTGSGTRE